MGFKFNPFSGNFDQTGSGGGGGGAQYIDGEVATYNDLPLDGTAALNSAWLVREASGIWPVSRKQAGIYIRTATAGSSRDADYTYAGTLPDVFSDSVFLLYDEASTTRTGQFNLGSITAGQNRVLTWPDGNGTIARTSDIPSTFAASAISDSTSAGRALLTAADASAQRTSLGLGSAAISASTDFAAASHNHAASAITSGVFDNARINFAAPDAIGSTTRNTIAATTLNANNGTITVDSPALVVAQDSSSATAFNLAEFRMTGVGTTNSNLIRGLSSGSQVFAVRRNGIIDATQLNWGNAWLLAGGNVSLPSGAYFGFTSGASGFSGQDTFIRRDAASTIAFRDLANPQTFRIYNTTDAGLTNFERGFMRWSSNVLQIGTEAGGTGSARNLEIRAGAATYTFTTPFTASPNNTVNHASIQAAGDTTNVSLSLVPKGSGALSARVPTGTGGAGGGGNARGAGAVDWQISTDSFSGASDVASGGSSVICGGIRNRASGSESLVCGGSGNIGSNTKSAVLCGNANTASGVYAAVLNGDSSQATADSALAHGRTAIASGTRSVAIGETATASAANSLAFGANVLANRIGMQAFAAGQFAAQGDAQRARFVLRCKTTTNAAVEMALDGGTSYLTIPNGKVMFCNIKVVGIRSDGVTVATYERQYAAKNLANVSSEVFAPVTIGTDLASGTTLEVATVDAGDYIRIRPTGVLNEVWRWVASVDCIECSYGT